MNAEHIILLAHGSVDADWCETFENGLEVIRGFLTGEASLAYMENAGPDLAAVIAREYRRGRRRFSVVPLFFAAGSHLKDDVPGQIEALRGEFPGVQVRLEKAVGHHPAFWRFLGGLIAEEVESRKAGEGEDIVHH